MSDREKRKEAYLVSITDRIDPRIFQAVADHWDSRLKAAYLEWRARIEDEDAKIAKYISFSASARARGQFKIAKAYEAKLREHEAAKSRAIRMLGQGQNQTIDGKTIRGWTLGEIHCLAMAVREKMSTQTLTELLAAYGTTKLADLDRRHYNAVHDDLWNAVISYDTRKLP